MRLQPLVSDKSRIQDFVTYVHRLDGDEKSEAQVFLDRLFIGFGHDGHKEAGATLEARVRKKGGGTSFADLRWGDRVLIEMKKRGEKLQKHFAQAFEYWINAVPHRPRYVVLCNFDDFWIYDLDLQVSEPVDRVRVDELPSRYDALNFLFPDNRPPLFGNNRVAVTRQAADKVAQVFQHLVARKIERADAQHFVLQCVAAMFSEDIGLLPDHIFSHLVGECAAGQSSYDLIGGLYRQMNDPKQAPAGRYAGVPYFNGGLFGSVQPVELVAPELELLREATQYDWSKVEPPVFGTLFEGSLDASERHAYGAHFTSEADILRVVLPTIVSPLRAQLDSAKSLGELIALRNALATFKVLDPACGSGNFLYIAYRELKRLEMELLQKAHDGFATGFQKAKTGPAIHVGQFFGLDTVPFAVELAKVTLTIGKKLAIEDARKSLDATQIDLDLEHDFERALPLDNLDANILCADALFSEWPKANAIIGNPPFQSKNKMQKEFGAQYVNKLRERYPDMPGRADYCVYWFRQAHDALPVSGRAGLVGTNTIRQNYSRQGGLDYIVGHGGTIVEAVSTQEWSGDAVVHVSIVNWVKGEQQGPKKLWAQDVNDPSRPWSIAVVDRINTALSVDQDVTRAKRLEANARAPVCFQGQTHGHEGFLMSPSEAATLFVKEPSSREVVFPYLIARELLADYPPAPSRWVIDFQGLTITGAAKYSGAFARVKSVVLPTREEAASKEDETNKALLLANPSARTNRHHRNFLNQWWQLSWAREDLVARIAALPRYIACSQVAKRSIFEFVSSAVRPNASLIVFAATDDYTFGVLQSLHHWTWTKATGSTLKGDYRYTSDTIFDTFPWPQTPSKAAVRNVAEASVALRNLRRSIAKDNAWSLREMYRSLEDPGKHPLKDAHGALDEAVTRAYGFSPTASLLGELLALNASLAEAELQKEKVVGPGLQAIGGQFSAAGLYVTTDCIES